MRGTLVALRYAKALLGFSQDAQASETVARDMLAINKQHLENHELQLVLENPLLSSEKKEPLLRSLFPKSCNQTFQLFSLLARNKRLSILVATGEQFLQLYAKQELKVNAFVTTAVALTPYMESAILEKAKGLTQEKIQIKNKVDPEILGGFILKIGDIQYDASVQHQLRAIKIAITKTNSI